MRGETSRISSSLTRPGVKRALSKTKADIQPDKPKFVDREREQAETAGGIVS